LPIFEFALLRHVAPRPSKGRRRSAYGRWAAKEPAPVWLRCSEDRSRSTQREAECGSTDGEREGSPGGAAALESINRSKPCRFGVEPCRGLSSWSSSIDIATNANQRRDRSRGYGEPGRIAGTHPSYPI
jgi:hypothetical protein